MATRRGRAHACLVAVLILAGLAGLARTQVTISFDTLGAVTYNLKEGSIQPKFLAEICVQTTSIEPCNTATVRCNVLNHNTPFDIWRNTSEPFFGVYFVGQANTPVQLSYAQKRSWNVTFTCNSTSSDHSTSTLEVDIIPNIPPVFTRNTSVIPVSAQKNAGETVLRPIVTEEDEEDTLTFTLNTSPAVDYFNINPRTGEITAAKDLRTATVSEIRLEVTVSDGRVTVGPEYYFLNLSLNARPVIDNLPMTVYVSEDNTELVISTPFEFRDDRSAAPYHPACIVSPFSESYKFVINGASAPNFADSDLQFETNASLPRHPGISPFNYERVSVYTINCTIFDGYLYSVDDVLTIRVLNVNEPPEFDKQVYVVDIYEGKAGEVSAILPVTITDPENDVITVVNFTRSLTGSTTPTSDRFVYDFAQKRLSFTLEYDVDNGAMPTREILTLQAFDEERAVGNATVIVNILDVNDNAPNFTSTAIVCAVDTSSALGLVASIGVDDRDLTAPNNLWDVSVIASEPAGQTFFDVTPDGDLYYVTDIPDSYAPSTYRLTLRATDRGSPRLSSTTEVVCTFTVATTTTTSSTTTTTTTTTPATTTTTTSTTTTTTAATTTAAPSTGLSGAEIALIVLGSLLGALLLGALLYLLLRLCGCCGLGANGGAGQGFCQGADCSCEECDCCSAKPQTPKVSPQKGRSDYKPDFWRTNDHYEDGRRPEGVRPSSIQSVGHGINSARGPAPRPDPPPPPYA